MNDNNEYEIPPSISPETHLKILSDNIGIEQPIPIPRECPYRQVNPSLSNHRYDPDWRVPRYIQKMDILAAFSKIVLKCEPSGGIPQHFEFVLIYLNVSLENYFEDEWQSYNLSYNKKLLSAYLSIYNIDKALHEILHRLPEFVKWGYDSQKLIEAVCFELLV
jgi:hypothetical protein